MLNLRKLRQDFSSSILQEGKTLFDEGKVVSAKILHLDSQTVRISAQILGQYKNTYESEIEIDRQECEAIDSDCDCPYHYDCQHLAALLYYLEAHLDEILVEYSQETDLDELEEDEEEKEKLLETMKEAATKAEQKKDEAFQKELLEEYISASDALAKSPFFMPQEVLEVEPAELTIHFTDEKKKEHIEFQIALRLKSRSKPLQIPYLKDFFEALRDKEKQVIGGKVHYFTIDSFDGERRELARILLDHTKFPEKVSQERGYRMGYIDEKTFGMLLAKAYEIGEMETRGMTLSQEFLPQLPCLFVESFEMPLLFSTTPAKIQMGLEYIQPPSSKLLLDPQLIIHDESVTLEETQLFACALPGVIHENVYYRFEKNIKREHLINLDKLREITIPEPLFGTFVENSLSELAQYVEIANREEIEDFVTLPFVGNLGAICDISYLNGELEAKLQFCYDDLTIPASTKELTFDHLNAFVSREGITARNLVEEQRIIEGLFRDFLLDTQQQLYVAKSEKKIIEFMTEVLPKFQQFVQFNCPQNLLDQFIYDESKFELALSHTDRLDVYQIDLKIHGDLKGVHVNQLWDCLVSKKAYIELSSGKNSKKMPKILVLDLEKMGKVVPLFDELGIGDLKNCKIERPVWNLANMDASHFKGLPVKFTMTKQLQDIRKQMLGEKVLKKSPIPKAISTEMRKYQEEGVHWLERLRTMFLNGILADDMGLGKTLQAIVAITQVHKKDSAPTLIVCPTSLLYNWKEEFAKFNSKLSVLIIDGLPVQRKKLMENILDYDVIITSYSLLQKDIDFYKKITFQYAILDEAQHIKNRTTRNAKSTKMIKADHRMVLSGTPIENSLDELWSLFDFLMPGFLSSYERFMEKYIRVTGDTQSENLEYLRKKVAPFIMRRMKSDVLDDLPPVSELVYHCQLSEVQDELYRSYAESARDELTKLVERDGFDKVQIHVLATLTRLKQICCHPAIFAKENPEVGDSAKYEMLMELLQTLIEGKHKTVIFSQYTGMLKILRSDLEKKGVRFSYLDGSSRNRMSIVKEFNEDPDIPLFLVSLKAGGTGLNLTGADSVIHYDMWWNPAVENQATDRVHRIGQKQNVSVYKLVTMGTIEEKIVEMQNRKKGIVKKVVSCDDDAITKLTWEDVLELLQT